MVQDTAKTRSAAEFDEYSRTYDDAVNRALAFSGMNVDFFTRAKAEYLLELVRAAPGAETGPALLDVGCGVGNFHPLLADGVGRIVGIDVSPECIAVARERQPAVEYAVYDGTHVPYPNAAFDAVYASNVMHHVPVAQRPALVREMRRVLKPGGVIVIFEHNPFNPLTRYVVGRCEFDKDAVLLRRQESETLLREAGFSAVASRFILTLPAVNRTLRKLDRLFAGLPLGAQYYTTGTA
jgi:ubiquinone/menaquinone biosynthesis C-methylase UbiE